MSTLRVGTISNSGGTASTSADNVINGSAKAWVNFNGTGTVAIRAGYNVSSITDNGTGNYTVNFTTALADANYAGTMGFSNQSSTSQVQAQFNGTQSTTSIGVIGTNSASTAFVDLPEIGVSIFR